MSPLQLLTFLALAFPKAGAGDYSSGVGSTITCFYGGCELKVVFTFLNGWKKLKEEFVTCANEAHFPFLRPDKALREDSHTHTYTLSLAAFVADSTRCREPVWTAKSRVFTLWLFTENVCPPLSSRMDRSCLDISLSASLPSAIHVRI